MKLSKINTGEETYCNVEGIAAILHDEKGPNKKGEFNTFFMREKEAKELRDKLNKLYPQYVQAKAVRFPWFKRSGRGDI